MTPLIAAPRLVDQVYEAILSAITNGRFDDDRRLIQEDIAIELGVSRQPVQQALLLLRSQGLLREAPGRGLMLAPFDVVHMRHLYEIRGTLDGLATRKAAQSSSDLIKEGPEWIAKGRAAIKGGSVADMIAADLDFHLFLYKLSGNPLIAESSVTHWSYLRRVMAEVLMRGETPREIWDQHEAILDAVVARDPDTAERLATMHISHAADILARRMADDDKDKPAAAGKLPTYQMR